MKGILTKLGKIQADLKAPKNQYNHFGKYKYRNCEDILEGVKPLLEKVGATLTITDDIMLIGDRYYIKAMATIYDTETGECISNSALAREEISQKGMSSAQVTGSTSSYARKYALNGLFAIDDTKDDDSKEQDDIKPKEYDKQLKQDDVKLEEDDKQKDDEKLIQVFDYLKKDVERKAKILEFYKIKDVKEIPKKEIATIYNKFKKEGVI